MPIQTEKGLLKPIIYVGAMGPRGLLLVKYKTAPNPAKQGWWLPAPEIEYGHDPSEAAAHLVKDFGLDLRRLALVGIESFIANDAWHLMAKYRCEVTGDVKNDNVSESCWVTAETLPPATDFAHGNWEVELCRFFLADAPVAVAH